MLFRSRNDADRLFVIGNGSFESGDTLRSNALTMLKNGNTGLGTEAPAALLHVQGTATRRGNVLFAGEFSETTPGAPPASGAGTRLMWYPGKSAFRAGTALETSWDQGSIGNYSVALGLNPIASGVASFAAGSGAKAAGEASAAVGTSAEAGGNNAMAVGYFTQASRSYTFAAGSQTVASEEYAVAFGNKTTASGKYALSAGQIGRAHV